MVENHYKLVVETTLFPNKHKCASRKDNHANHCTHLVLEEAHVWNALFNIPKKPIHGISIKAILLAILLVTFLGWFKYVTLWRAKANRDLQLGNQSRSRLELPGTNHFPYQVGEKSPIDPFTNNPNKPNRSGTSKFSRIHCFTPFAQGGHLSSWGQILPGALVEMHFVRHLTGQR